MDCGRRLSKHGSATGIVHGATKATREVKKLTSSSELRAADD